MTRQRSWLAAVAVLVSLALLAACDGDKPPERTTTITSSRPSPPANPAAKAPPVKNPLDAAAFEADPCKSLTEAQQKRFAYDSGKIIDATREGETCVFRKGGTRVSTTVTFASKVTEGLSFRYAEYKFGYWSYWEPMEVDGYPAVAFYTTHSTQPDPRSCNFAVGITDSLYFWVTADAHNGNNGCVEAKDVASAVLLTVKAGR